MQTCSAEANKSLCNCTFSCSRKGVCCECLSYHRGQGQFPACYFPTDAEKTGDRSIENFVELFRERGPWW